MQLKGDQSNSMNKISRKTFLKDLSYISLGIISFSNMLMAAEAGNLILKNILPIKIPKNIKMEYFKSKKLSLEKNLL